MRSLGLVFSGGGSCGAYQIGFWKALREAGVEKLVSAVSGSSVGSLNALLFANGKAGLAADIWKGLKQTDLLRLRNFLDGRGIFSQAGYAAFVDRLKERWKDIADGMPVYSCVSVLNRDGGGLGRIDLLHREAGRPEYILLNELSFDAMKNVLLASSAMPYIYPHRRVKGMTCIDGDFSDKTPYRPLAVHGCDAVIILHLNSREEAARRRLESDERYDPESGMKLYHLYPSGSLGNYILVSRRLTQKRIRTGYEEGKQFLDRLLHG